MIKFQDKIDKTSREDLYILTGVSAIIITGYVISYCIRLGIPASISASYYRLHYPIMFSLTIWASALTLTLPLIYLSRGRRISLIASYCLLAGLLLVGSAPNFLETNQAYIHDGGARLAIISSTVWVYRSAPRFLWLWMVFLVYEMYLLIAGGKFPGSTVFVAETVTMASLYLSVFKRIQGQA